MDSAGSYPLAQAFAALEVRLARHEQLITSTQGELVKLTRALSQHIPLPASPPSNAPTLEEPALAVSDPQPTSTPAPVTFERSLPTPEPFTGELDKCAGFLMQCSLQFRQQQHLYASDGAKIAYFVQLLCDRALRWSQVVLKSNPDISYADFLLKFRSVFDKGSSAAAAGHWLLNLKQGKRSMADYSIDFGILAEETGWGQEALMRALLNNVCEALMSELMLRELPSSLDALMTLWIRVDEHLRAHWSTQDPPFRDLPARGAAMREPRTPDELGHGGGEEEPMQLGCSRLSAAERNR